MVTEAKTSSCLPLLGKEGDCSLKPPGTHSSYCLCDPSPRLEDVPPCLPFCLLPWVRVNAEAFTDVQCLCGCHGLESHRGSLEVEEFLHGCFSLVVVSRRP